MITTLPAVIEAAPGRPRRPGAAENQRFVADILRDCRTWTAETASVMQDRYEVLAQSWDAERGWYRPVPARDALVRGAPWPSGNCVEIGAGTGLITTVLAAKWPRLLAVDLSLAMTRRSSHPLRVVADGSALPLPDRSARVVAVTDAPLFPDEVARVLTDDGVVLWTNALGDDAPFHVPTSRLVAVMRTATGAEWDAVESTAGWGSWAVLRRQAGS